MKYLVVFLLIASALAGGNKNGKKSKDKGDKGDKGDCVNTCDKQSECLNVEIEEVTVNNYEVCIWWNSELQECKKNKMDSITSICYGDKKSDKKEGCNSGKEEKICREVPCGEFAEFALKDQKDCEANDDDTVFKAYAFSNEHDIFCKVGTNSNMCGGGSKKDCVWYFEAPECNATTSSTTTDTPVTGTGMITTDDSSDTTSITMSTTPGTTEECIRESDIESICQNQNSNTTCSDAHEGAADRCEWVEHRGECRTSCGWYNTLNTTEFCEGACGCEVFVGDNTCVGSQTLNSAANAAMREDIYVVEAHEEQASGVSETEIINGIDNMYFYIGVGVIGFVVLVGLGIGCVVIKGKKRKYVEMDDNNGQEVEMNIEVDGVNHTTRY